jgi:hypothetical protein
MCWCQALLIHEAMCKSRVTLCDLDICSHLSLRRRRYFLIEVTPPGRHGAYRRPLLILLVKWGWSYSARTASLGSHDEGMAIFLFWTKYLCLYEEAI